MPDALEGKLNYMKTYLTIIDKLQYKAAIIIDTEEAKMFINQLVLSGGRVQKHLFVFKNIRHSGVTNCCVGYDSDWIDGVDIVFLVRLSIIDSHELSALVRELKLKKPNIAIFDQGALCREFTEQPTDHFFRGLLYKLNRHMLIPSYYYNDLYIDKLVVYINAQHVKNMLDMCTGSGCVGLSCFNETELDFLWCVDINPNDIQSLKATIQENDLDLTRVHPILSDAFDNIPRGLKFDLISANPPNYNVSIKKVTDHKGADFEWGFHKRFFALADQYLADKGVICFIERKFNSDTQMFANLVKESNSKLELFDSFDLKGTDYYLIYVKKRSNG